MIFLTKIAQIYDVFEFLNLSKVGRSLVAVDSRLSYGENPKSLSHLVLEWYHDVTDKTDGQTDGQNCRSYYAL